MEIRGELSTSNQQTGYLIFYGTKGTHYSITNDFYDQYIMSDIFIYNGDMQMQTDIDMNNHSFKNIPPPINPTDLLMKKSIEIYPISLHGTINRDKYFTTNNQKLFLFQIDIGFILIFGANAHIATQDKLTINYINQSGRRESYNFPFSFHQSHPNVRIGINREIKGKLESINTLKTFNVPFILFYLPVTIKTT